jgi:predicted negative regulator of RcsB-dependent stress response
MPTRRERRVQRKRTEEVMSWFLVPVILILVWLVGWQVWNAMFPERNTVVQTRSSTPTPPR